MANAPYEPIPDIAFDLDAVQREKTTKPFVVKINDKTTGEPHLITMTDPQEINVNDLVEIDQPIQFLRYVIGEDDKAWLSGQNIPGWQFGELMKAYMRHFGLATPGKSGVLGI